MRTRSSWAGSVLAGTVVVVLGGVVGACSQASTAPPETQSGGGGGGVGGGSSGFGEDAASADANTPAGTHTDGAGASETIPSSSTAGYVVKVGSGVGVAPGVQVGYALTASALKTYQLRWTGNAKVEADGYQEFYGSVWTTGTFTSVTPGCVNQACPLEQGDYLSAAQTVAGGGQRIDWDTFASTGWDGFSFTTDTEPLYFDVYIDGKRYPQLFYFPDTPNGAQTSPAASPFAISSAD